MTSPMEWYRVRPAMLAATVLLLVLLDATRSATVPPPPASDSRPRAIVRWCTDSAPAQLKCTALGEAIAHSDRDDRDDDDDVHIRLECHQRATSGECLWEVGQGSLDVTSVRFRDSYFAGRAYGLIPTVAEAYTRGSEVQQALYKSIVVLRKGSTHVTSLADLKGLKSCHTVVYRNAGWAIPMSQLVTSGLLTGDCLDNVENAAKFFSESCAATSQKPSYNWMRANVSNLCNLCAGTGQQKCTEDDPFAGYEGAFRCLRDGHGEVAFLRNGIIEEETIGQTEVGKRQEDFELLCPDGSHKPVNEYEYCNWGMVPPRVVMASPQLQRDARQKFKSFFLRADEHLPNFNLFDSATYGGRNLLFSDSAMKLHDPKTENYREFTGPTYVRTLENQTVACPSTVPATARWCVVSPPEIAKCNQMAVAFEFWFVKPRIQCVVATSLLDCMAKIRDGSADLITLDGGQIFTGGKHYNLKPIMFEDYGTGDSKYWAVAVVKKKDTSTSFTNLKGKRSCHTGVGRTAGWDVPIATLIKSGQIQVADKRNILSDVSKFFRESCAPGALQSASKSSSLANLCALCKGQGDNHCALKAEEPYFGYTGAFRCLVEGGGDVAFINHLTVGENTNGKNPDDWARSLKPDDFELLCPDGQRRPVSQYEQCSLAKVPAHAVVTANSKTPSEVDAFIHSLEKGQEFYKEDTNPSFRLFASGAGSKDILFRDATTQLLPIPEASRDYKVYLGDFLATAEFLEEEPDSKY